MTPDSALLQNIPEFSIPEQDVDITPIPVDISPTTVANPRLASAYAPKPESFVMGNLKAGAIETGGMLAGGVGALADIVGLDTVRDWGYDTFMESQKAAQQVRPRMVESIADIESPTDAAIWTLETALRTTPTMATSLISGGAGAALGAYSNFGSSLLKNAGAKAISSRVSTLMAAGMTKEMAEAAALKSLRTSVLTNTFLAGGTGLMEGGSNWGQDAMEQGKYNTSPIQDMSFGLAAGIIETLGGLEAGWLRKFTGKPVSEQAERTFMQAVKEELPKAMLGESSTETAQQLLSNVNARMNRGGEVMDFSLPDFMELLDAAAAGAIMGAGGAFILPNSRRPSHIPTAKDSNVTKPTDQINAPAVDKNAEIQKVTEQVDPFDTRTEQERVLMGERFKRYAQAEQEVEADYTKAMTATAEKLRSIESTLEEMDNPTKPIAKLADPKQMEKARAKLQKEQANLIALNAARSLEKADSIKNLQRRRDKEAEQSGKRIAKAHEVSVTNDYNARRAQFETDPFVYSQLQNVASDAERFANRQVNILGERVNTIFRALSKYNQQLEADSSLLNRNPGMYSSLMKNADMLRDKLKDTNNQITLIQDKAKQIIRDTANVSTADIGKIQTQLNELYSLRDLKAEGGHNKDVAVVMADAIKQTYESGVRQQVQDLNKLGVELTEKDALKDPTVLTERDMLIDSYWAEERGDNFSMDQRQQEADAILGEAFKAAQMQDALQTQARRSLLEQVHGGADPYLDSVVSGVTPKGTFSSEAFRPADPMGQSQYSELEKAAVIRREEVRSKQALEQRTAVEQNRIQGRLAQARVQEQAKTLQQAAEAVAVANKEIQDQVQAAQEAELKRNREKTSAMDRVFRAEEIKQERVVYEYLQNVLNRMPALREVTTVCTTHTDMRIPVALHDAIVRRIREGGVAPRAVYYNGRIYLFAKHIENQGQAVRALIHEGVVHFGLRSLFDDVQLGNFLNLVHSSFEGSEKWQTFLKTRAAYRNSDRITQAEEFVAWLAENRKAGNLTATEKGIFAKLYDFIVGVVKKLTTKDPTSKLTLEDVDNVLKASAINLTRKAKPNLAQSMADAVSYYYTNENEKAIPIELAKDTPQGWGMYFSNPSKTIAWFNNYNKTMSGTPNTTVVDSTPLPDSFGQWSKTIAEQSLRVRDAIASIPNSMLYEVKRTEDGKLLATYGNTLVGLFNTNQELENYVKAGLHLSNVTYESVYNKLAAVTGSRKNAARILREVGIAGSMFKQTNKNGKKTDGFVVYNGEDVSLHEPKYLIEDSKLPPTSYVEESLRAAEEYNSKWYRAKNLLNMKENWMKALRFMRTKGTTLDDDGNIIKHSWWNRFIEGIDDPYERIKIVQRGLKEMYENAGLANPITHKTNVYKQLGGLSNIIHSKQIDFANSYVQPLAEALHKLALPENLLAGAKDVLNLKFAVAGDYLRAKHALERNQELRSRIKWNKGKRTTDYTGGPSGMSDAEAQATIDKYENLPGMKEVAEAVYAMNTQQLNIIEKNHALPQDAIDKLRSTYKYYVPLQGWSELIQDFLPANNYRTSSGISTGGKPVVKEAKGRDKDLPENPLIASITRSMDVISYVEKNNISRNLLELVRSTPDVDLWQVVDTEDIKYRLQKDGKGSLVFRKKPHPLSGQGYQYVRVIDNKGKLVSIAIKDQALAKAFLNQNMMHVHKIIDTIRDFTRKISALNTNYNPAFFLPNPIRDVETALLNLSGVIDENIKQGLLEDGASIRKNIVKDISSTKIPRFLWRVINNKVGSSTEEQRLLSQYNDFRRYGGHTRMFSARDFTSAYKYLRSEVRKGEGGVMTNLTKGMEYLDKMSDVGENATRFSVYVHVLESFQKNLNKKAKAENWTADKLRQELEFAKERSANIALEITVNFTRKGTWSPLTNALWAFSSASIGGNVRILKNIFRRGETPLTRVKRLGVFLGSSLVSSFLLTTMNRMLMGDDDDGINKYDKIADYIKANNFIIASPFGDGGYIKIPIAYGYNIFWIASNEIEKLVRGATTPARSSIKIMTSMFDNFSPVGGTEGGIAAFTPTLLRPIVEIATNQNFAGTPIYPKSFGYKTEGPDAYKKFASNPIIYQEIAEVFNAVSGGNRTRSGMIDFSPESLQHVVESYGGGLSKVIFDTFSLSQKGLLGMPIEGKEVPIVNKFIGKVGYTETASKFSNAAKEVYIQTNSVDLAKKDPNISPRERQKIVNDSRVGMSLKANLEAANKKLQDFKKEEEALLKRYPSKGRAYFEQTKLIERRKERAMKSFLSAVERRGLDYAK